MSEKQVRDYDKFMLRFPDGLRDAVAERAKANGRSMNSEIIQIIEDALNLKSPAKATPINEAHRTSKYNLSTEQLEQILEKVIAKTLGSSATPKKKP
ncbi:Arc family DNA-binding protein [Pectobacterium odoriferum]|uniref:Arc family DNA-binding protein n=1 Tax=Pectobacterium odoriferum TaxID=78398 RepID=UPI0032EFF67C